MILQITVNDLNIHYTDIGEGQPILMLHGWGSSLDVWHLITENLKDRFRVVSLDFPGCGKSDLPKAPLDLEDYTALVYEFSRQLNLKNPIIFGHSNGGRVAIKLLADGSMKCKKAVLFDSAGIFTKKNPLKKIKIAAFKTVKFFLTLPVIKNHTQETLKKARTFFGSADYNNAPVVMRQTMVNLLRHDLTALLPKISCPTLLIWGEKDTATPLSDAKKMEKLIPDCGLCSFPGCGHFSFLERPGETNTILNSFLGK